MSAPTGFVDVSKLNGYFKEVYADKLNNLVPAQNKLARMIPFSAGTKIGKTYNQPVVLSQELGFIHAPAGAGAYTLADAIPSETENAQVNAYQTSLRSGVDFESLFKSGSDKASFERIIGSLPKWMKISAEKRMEILMLHGQRGLGVVETFTNNGATGSTIKITDASFAPGIWAGCKNLLLDGTVSVVAGSVAATNSAFMKVTAYDYATRTLTVSCSNFGTFANGDSLIFHDSAAATVWQEMHGLTTIARNTGSLYGINAATQDLWKSPTRDMGGVDLTLHALLDAQGVLSGNGLEDDTIVVVSNQTMGSMLADQSALRKFDASYSKEGFENGGRYIKFYGDAGMIEIVPHAYQKRSEAIMFNKDQVKRIGTTDTTFEIPGSTGSYFHKLENSAGLQIQTYSALDMFHEAPAQMFGFYGITNTTS